MMKLCHSLKLSTLIFLSCLMNPAAAVIELLEIRRVSGRVLVPIQGEQVTVYGGIAGNPCPNASPTELCDSCANTTGLEACNTQRIFDDLLVQFEFRSNAVAGFPLLRTNQSEIVPARNSLLLQPIGATQVLEVRWGDICRLIPQATSCENANGQIQLNLGVTPERDQASGGDLRTILFRVGGPIDDRFNTNKGCSTDDVNANEGICDFTAFPGDGKAFITDLASGEGFPLVSGLDAQFVRVFVSDEGFISRPSDSLEPQDLRISSTDDLSLEKRVVDRLENGTRYFFRVATVDVAGNVANFTDNQTIVDTCGSLENPNPDCPYAARPDEVLGLLTDDFNCFIASATLGNPLAPSLDVLRKFRSQILFQFDWGKLLIRWYYKKGPYAAKWISDRPWAQWLLTPFVWVATLFASLSLKLGLLGASLTTGFVLLLGFSVKTISKSSIWRRLRREGLS